MKKNFTLIFSIASFLVLILVLLYGYFIIKPFSVKLDPVIENKIDLEEKDEDIESEQEENINNQQEDLKKDNTSNNTESSSNNTSEKKETTTKPSESSSSNSNSNNNNSSNNNVTTKPKEKTAWEKLGLTEHQYYNEPIHSWQRVDYKTLSECESNGIWQIEANGGTYKCSEVISYSGKTLGYELTIY